MNYKIDKNKFILEGNVLEFQSEIDTVLKKDGVYMILILENDMNRTGEHYGSRNIFGVSEEGEILWQVEAPTKDPVDLYTQMNEVEGKIIAGSWSCFLCELDPGTGKIIDKEFTK